MSALLRRWSIGRIAKYAAFLTLFFVVAFTGWQYWLFSGGIFATSTFNKALWKGKPSGRDLVSCYRGGMARDIKANILITGLAMGKVLEILGEPGKRSSTEFQYQLGVCSRFRIDFDFLHIRFNERGEINDVVILQH